MFIHTVAGILALIYGTLIAFDALKKMRRNELTPGSAALLGFTGLVVMFSSLYIPFQIIGASYALILGLIAMHILTIWQDKNKETEFNPKPHIARFIFSVIIIIFALTKAY